MINEMADSLNAACSASDREFVCNRLAIFTCDIGSEPPAGSATKPCSFRMARKHIPIEPVDHCALIRQRMSPNRLEHRTDDS